MTISAFVKRIAVGSAPLAHDQARLLAGLERDDHGRERDRRCRAAAAPCVTNSSFCSRVEEHHELGRLAFAPR